MSDRGSVSVRTAPDTGFTWEIWENNKMVKGGWEETARKARAIGEALLKDRERKRKEDKGKVDSMEAARLLSDLAAQHTFKYEKKKPLEWINSFIEYLQEKKKEFEDAVETSRNSG